MLSNHVFEIPYPRSNIILNLQQELDQVKSWACQVLSDAHYYRETAQQQILMLQNQLKQKKSKGLVVLYNSTQPFWSMTSTGRWRRKKKLREVVKERLKDLPKDLKPVEVKLYAFS